MAAGGITYRSHRFITAGLVFLVAWQVGVLAGVPRATEVRLALFGFVFHVLFAKAYALVPSYFDRDLATDTAMTVQFPLSALGAAALAASPFATTPAVLELVGALLWTAGVAVFVGTLVWTVRDNLSGRETATGEAKADRKPVDRYANAFVPVALLYLVVASYELLAASLGLPHLLDAFLPRVTHLFAAGAAALLLFAVGFRLLPRFLVATPPDGLVAVVLPAGALGPLLLAVGLTGGPWLRFGAVVEAVAVLGFAAAYGWLFRTSERRRVGFYAVLAGVVSATLAVALGLWFAFEARPPAFVLAHLRLNLLGFLGLSILGVTYQFYPPNAGRFPGANDRLALVTIGLVAGGLWAEAYGLVFGVPAAETVGGVAALAGAVGYAYIIGGLFRQIRG